MGTPLSMSRSLDREPSCRSALQGPWAHVFERVSQHDGAARVHRRSLGGSARVDRQRQRGRAWSPVLITGRLEDGRSFAAMVPAMRPALFVEAALQTASDWEVR